jgi:hypothetical protein
MVERMGERMGEKSTRDRSGRRVRNPSVSDFADRSERHDVAASIAPEGGRR